MVPEGSEEEKREWPGYCETGGVIVVAVVGEKGVEVEKDTWEVGVGVNLNVDVAGRIVVAVVTDAAVVVVAVHTETAAVVAAAAADVVVHYV